MVPRFEVICYLAALAGTTTLIGLFLVAFGYLALSRFSSALLLRLQKAKVGTPLLFESFVRSCVLPVSMHAR